MIKHKHILKAPRLELAPAWYQLRHLFFVMNLVYVRHLCEAELLLFSLLRCRCRFDSTLHRIRLVDTPNPIVGFSIAVDKTDQEVGHVDLDASTAMDQPVSRVDGEQVLWQNPVEEAHIGDADEAVIHFVQTRLRLQVRHLAVVRRVARRRRYFRHDRAHVPVEARALELPLERPTPLQRRHVAGVETRPLRRPVPRGRVEEVLPLVHPQLGDTHQVLLHDLLPVAVERVGERLEGVSHSRARVSEDLQRQTPSDAARHRHRQIRSDTVKRGQTQSGIGRHG